METGIVVRDLEVTTRFYRDGLGLAHIRDEVTPFGLLRRFKCGNAGIKLMKLDEPPNESNPGGGLGAAVTGLRWISIPVDDIEEVLKRCEETGARIVQPIYEWSPTVKLMTVEDPEGNCWIEVAQIDGEY